jgi:RimJ/RimL family protein N-acetyltransferase
MKISYRPVKYDSMMDCELLAIWANDLATKVLVSPTRPNLPFSETTAEEIREKALKETVYKPLHDQMILVGDRPVGTFQLIMNPPHKKSRFSVAWPSLVIGEASFRRSGIGSEVALHISSLAKIAGASHIEAGVFEHNSAIRAFLEKHDFLEIGRVENFTWHEGQPKADVRYERAIETP